MLYNYLPKQITFGNGDLIRYTNKTFSYRPLVESGE